MNNTKTAAIEVRFFRLFEDGSGAPANLACGPYVFACDKLGNRVSLTLIAPVSGSRVQNEIAVKRCRAFYESLVAEKTDAAWKAANAEMYSDEYLSGFAGEVQS